MSDILEFESIVFDYDRKIICEDEYAGHEEPVEAEWFTSHGDCGYFICSGCKTSDEHSINNTIVHGDTIGCAMCGEDVIDPHSIKFVAI